MPAAVAVVLGIALGLYLVNRADVGAMLGGLMLPPSGACADCKGGA